MRVVDLRWTRRGARAVLSARVEAAPPGLPSRLAFAIPTDFAAIEEPPRADAFAVALFPLAMASGRAMQFEGPLSPRLLMGLEEMMAAFALWHRGVLRAVSIDAARLEPIRTDNHAASAVVLGGGEADARYLERRRSAFPTSPTTLGGGTGVPLVTDEPLAGHGQDAHATDMGTDRNRREHARLPIAAYALAPRAVAVPAPMQRLEARTNAGAFLAAAGRTRTRGLSAVALAHAMAPRLGLLFLPARRGFAALRPSGTGAWIDPWLSTEALRIRTVDADGVAGG